VTSLRKFLERPRAAAWAFFFAALAARVAVVLLKFDGPPAFADERMYLRLADVIGSGNWLGERSTAAPGPVYFWGTLRALGFSLDTIRLIHAVIGAAAVSVAFLLGRRLFGPVPAALGAVVMTGYPYLLFLAGLLYPQSVFHLTILLVFYFLLRWMQGGGARWLVLGGVALGICALFVVPILSATPIVALWILLAGRGTIVARAGAVAVVAALCLATILPATARNYLVTGGRFVLLSEMGGSAFYWANNDLVDPYDRDAEEWLVKFRHRLEREQARQGWTELDMRPLLQERANRFWREQTPRALRNFFIRWSFFFDVAPRSFTANDFTRDRTNEIVAIVTSVPVLLLFPIGAWWTRRRWRLWFPLLAVPLLQSLTYALFHVSVRYRIPFEACFILLAAAGLCGLVWPELLLRDAGGQRSREQAGRTS
jgi:4-amino-4-deoxy-L-arabinose transferase-like glycosyltransferase